MKYTSAHAFFKDLRVARVTLERVERVVPGQPARVRRATTVTVEELYAHFKARLLAELRAAQGEAE